MKNLNEIKEIEGKINMLYDGLPKLKHCYYSKDSDVLKQYDSMMKAIESLENYRSYLIGG